MVTLLLPYFELWSHLSKNTVMISKIYPFISQNFPQSYKTHSSTSHLYL